MRCGGFLVELQIPHPTRLIFKHISLEFLHEWALVEVMNCLLVGVAQRLKNMGQSHTNPNEYRHQHPVSPSGAVSRQGRQVWQIGGGVGIDLWGDGLNDERCLGDDFPRIKQEGWHLTKRINGGQLGRIFLR